MPVRPDYIGGTARRYVRPGHYPSLAGSDSTDCDNIDHVGKWD